MGRIVGALPTAEGKVLIRDRAGHRVLVDSVARECSARGRIPLIEHVSNAEIRTVISSMSSAELSRWDVDRVGVAAEISGLIILGGWPLDLGGLLSESVDAWSAAMGRVEAVIDSRCVPTVVVAVPTDDIASDLGLSLEALEAQVMPSILLPASELASKTNGVADALGAGSTIEIRTPVGSLLVERAGERVSHLGVGTNPSLGHSIGWTIVDEHRRGSVFLALGENRYLGGENASEINVDLLPASPTVLVRDRVVVAGGEIVLAAS